MAQVIDIGGVLEKSWKIFKDNLSFVVGVGAIFFAVSLFTSVAGDLIRTITGVNEEVLMENFSFEKFVEFLPVLLSIILISFVVSAILKLGLLKVFLSLVDGNQPNFNDLWATNDYLPKYFGAVLLMALPIIVGFAFFILPGLYIYIRLQFFSILIIDKNLGPLEALEASWRLTKGRTLDMFLVLAVLTALILAGSLAAGVGLIFTLPLALIFFAIIYRVLNPVVSETNQVV